MRSVFSGGRGPAPRDYWFFWVAWRSLGVSIFSGWGSRLAASAAGPFCCVRLLPAPRVTVREVTSIHFILSSLSSQACAVLAASL